MSEHFDRLQYYGKADNVYVQLCDFGWADLGTWDALYDASPKDTNHNVIINSNTVLYNCKDSIILVPEGQLAVVQDLDGYLVASRDNVLLICKKMTTMQSASL